VKEPIRQLTG